jgi:holo-[acyl-carrier protein] synthase
VADAILSPAGDRAVASPAGDRAVAGAMVGLGLDSVEVDRFGAVLTRRPTLLDHLFTEGERAYAAHQRNPVPSLAARFAVKEAVMKALGVGLGAIGWHDVEVVRAAGGRPELTVTGRAGDLAATRGIASWQVSITHTHRSASAVVAGLS